MQQQNLTPTKRIKRIEMQIKQNTLQKEKTLSKTSMVCGDLLYYFHSNNRKKWEFIG